MLGSEYLKQKQENVWDLSNVNIKLHFQHQGYIFKNYNYVIEFSSWAEQSPFDWWEAVGKASKKLITEIRKTDNVPIVGLSIDTTCCSVLALDDDLRLQFI